MTTITIPLTDEQITDLTNGKSVVITPPATHKPKSELDLLKEKYESGEYICIYKEYIHLEDKHNHRWYIKDKPLFTGIGAYKLIHKKHKDILNAYLTDNSVEIEFKTIEVLEYFFDSDPTTKEVWYRIQPNEFIECYSEFNEYRLKPKQEYPIFKRNEDGEVFKIVNNAPKGFNVTCTISNSLSRIGYPDGEQFIDDSYETIPHDKETGLYHLQPVWCWDYTDKYMRQIRFYSKNNKTIYHRNSNSELIWDNIEPITTEQLKTMPFIWDMYTNLLKSLTNTQIPL